MVRIRETALIKIKINKIKEALKNLKKKTIKIKLM